MMSARLARRLAAALVLGVGCLAEPDPIEGSGSATEADGGTGSAGTTATDGGSGSSGGAGVIGPLLPLDDFDDGAIYPTAAGYDAKWYPSGEAGATGLGYLGQFPEGNQYYGYFRFQLPEALTAGSSIASAVLELSGHDVYNWTGAEALRVWVQQSTDAAQVAGLEDYPAEGGMVVLSEGSVRWPEDGGLDWNVSGSNASPNLAPILQALVDSIDGLEAGAHVQLWVGVNVLDGSEHEVGWIDSAAGSSNAAKLTIELAE